MACLTILVRWGTWLGRFRRNEVKSRIMILSDREAATHLRKRAHHCCWLRTIRMKFTVISAFVVENPVYLPSYTIHTAWNASPIKLRLGCILRHNSEVYYTWALNSVIVSHPRRTARNTGFTYGAFVSVILLSYRMDDTATTNGMCQQTNTCPWVSLFV